MNSKSCNSGKIIINDVYIYYIYILYELMDANGALLTITIYFCSVEAGPGV